jgi:hypothetical protein
LQDNPQLVQHEFSGQDGQPVGARLRTIKSHQTSSPEVLERTVGESLFFTFEEAGFQEPCVSCPCFLDLASFNIAFDTSMMFVRFTIQNK